MFTSRSDNEFEAIAQVLEVDPRQPIPLDEDFVFAMKVSLEMKDLGTMADKLFALLDQNCDGYVHREDWVTFADQWHASGQCLEDFVAVGAKAKQELDAACMNRATAADATEKAGQGSRAAAEEAAPLVDDAGSLSRSLPAGEQAGNSTVNATVQGLSSNAVGRARKAPPNNVTPCRPSPS